MKKSVEISKEDFVTLTKEWGIAQKYYNDLNGDNAWYSEDGAVAIFSHGELQIVFIEGFETYEVNLGDWSKQCSSKANAKKLVKFMVEKGQKEDGEIEDEEEETELYRLYKSSK